jgi:hypothetical protein
MGGKRTFTVTAGPVEFPLLVLTRGSQAFG